MNSISYQNTFTYYDLMLNRFSQFMGSFQQQSYYQDQVNNFNILEQRPTFYYHALQEVQSPSFQSRTEPSIILKSSLKSIPTPTTKSKKIKPPHKTVMVQKQSRNVLSNLLRILLRNIMETKYYDQLILKIINKYSLSCTLEEFHLWIQSFNINYKNYIRFMQIKKLLSGSENTEMHRIIRILMKQYCCDVGGRHCLTSRRIDPNSVNMHLGGLRQLLQHASCK